MVQGVDEGTANLLAQILVIQKAEPIHIRLWQIPVANTENDRVDQLVAVLQVTNKSRYQG